MLIGVSSIGVGCVFLLVPGYPNRAAVKAHTTNHEPEAQPQTRISRAQRPGTYVILACVSSSSSSKVLVLHKAYRANAPNTNGPVNRKPAGSGPRPDQALNAAQPSSKAWPGRGCECVDLALQVGFSVFDFPMYSEAYKAPSYDSYIKLIISGFCLLPSALYPNSKSPSSCK